MSLSSGARLGPYEIRGVIGAGGMGEVYRARDARLGRDVALKILPQRASDDPQRQARFEREARILAALNHPHVGAIYGFEDGDSTALGSRIRAIVLELVEGDTLAERISRGPIPITEALGIARQVAAALAAAHTKGIVHRDLKPANIKITPAGDVKVLDFGLAEIVSDGSASELAQAPTITASTREGRLAGTAPYMSPEQSRGQTVDGRTDIWAFGCVLYEMLAGRAVFARATMSDTIAAILHDEPEWTALPRATPPLILHLLRRCLAKDGRSRLQHISTIDELIGNALAQTDAKQPVNTRRTLTIAAVGGAVLLTAMVGALLTFSFRDNTVTQPTAASPIHRQLTFVGNVGDAALSPDGRRFAYTSEGRLLIQEVAGGTPAEIVGADVVPEEISTLRWSPSGDRLVFMTYDQHSTVLHIVSSHGGRPVDIAGTGVIPFTYTAWSPDGSRLAVTSRDDAGGFDIVDAADGRLIGVVALPQVQSGRDISWHPKLDQLAILDRGISERWVIWFATPDGRQAHPVYTDAQTITSICWSPIENRLYFLRIQNEAAELVALDLADRPPAVPRVLVSGLPAGGRLTISADGRSLLHVRSTATANLARLDLTSPDEPMKFITQGTRRFSSPRVSPDGQWIAAVVGVPPRTRVVKLPFHGGEPMPLTSGENLDGVPAWSPDGTRIAFASARAGTSSVWLMRADGSQLEQVRNSAPTDNLRTAWTPDGRLMWQEVTSAGGMNYRIRDLSSGHDSFLFPEQHGFVFLPEFAPNGKEFAVFGNGIPGPRGLYVVSWPGLVPRLLTPETYWPMGWSADGASVIAAGQQDIWLVSTQDGQSRRLTRLLLFSNNEGDVTSDGKYLVNSVGGSTADAWLIQDFDPRARQH